MSYERERRSGRVMYRVIARRNGGQGWVVSVEGGEGLSGLAVRDLAEIEARTRRHISKYTGSGADEIELEIEVVIPPETEQRFEVAEQLIEDAGAELGQAIDELFDFGLVPADVRWLLNHRRLALHMPALTISNAELAQFGLSRHPAVTGVRWSDHGFAVTVKCRDCVEHTREEYVDLEEAGTNDLLYGPVRCDLCFLGHPDRDSDDVFEVG